MYNTFYPEEIIEEVRINNDIVEVVSEYVRLERKGKDFFGLCPFHKEKTPSFSVAPSKQIFYCFGCGKGGNVIQYVMNIENLDYREAIRFLADRARIDLPEGGSREDTEKAKLRKEIIKINTEAARFFYNCLNSKDCEKARNFLRHRGLNESTVRSFGIGYSLEAWDNLYIHLLDRGFDRKIVEISGLAIKNKKGEFYDRFRGRIIFPIFDVRGNIIAFGGRVMDSSFPKYMNSPETLVYNKGKHLYALNFAKNFSEKRLIIVEGYMDVISLHQNGIINTVASLGTALTENQGRLLKKYAEEIVIAYDADTAGQKAAMRSLDLLNSIGCNVKVLVIPEGKDPDEFIKTNGAGEFNKLIDSALSLVEYKIKILKGQIDIRHTEGKIKFLNGIANILSKIDNNVEREMYIKKIAKDYEITQEALYSEVLRRIKPRVVYTKRVVGYDKKKDEGPRGTNDSSEERLVYDERFVLVLLCADNSLYKYVKGKLSIGSFTCDENREIAKNVFRRLESGKDIKPVELLNMVENDSAGVFSKIIKEESHCNDIKKAIMGKISSMEMIKTRKRLKEITGLLKDKDKQKEGDVEKLEQELKSLMIFMKRQKNV